MASFRIGRVSRSRWPRAFFMTRLRDGLDRVKAMQEPHGGMPRKPTESLPK